MASAELLIYRIIVSPTTDNIDTIQQFLFSKTELFIKVFAFLGKEETRSGNNHCVIGGYTPTGECGHNECTSLILKAITELPIWRPQVSYRVTAKTKSEQLNEVLEKNYKRYDLIMFLNDDVIIKKWKMNCFKKTIAAQWNYLIHTSLSLSKKQ